MAHSLNFNPHGHRGGGSASLFRPPTLNERIALALMEDERRATLARQRPGPSTPRRFSWEGEG